jgi:hypothetical protein
MSRTGVFDKDALFSTVKNTSGKARTFGFLPPHGVKLPVDGELTVFGNILERIPERRGQIAFLKAIDAGDIDIVKTPAQVILDTNGTSKILKSTAGTLSAIAPTWDTSDSAETLPA